MGVSRKRWHPQIMDYYKPSILGYLIFGNTQIIFLGCLLFSAPNGACWSLALAFLALLRAFLPTSGQSSEKQRLMDIDFLELQVVRNTSNYYVASSILYKIYRIQELQSMETSTFQILSKHKKAKQSWKQKTVFLRPRRQRHLFFCFGTSCFCWCHRFCRGKESCCISGHSAACHRLNDFAHRAPGKVPTWLAQTTTKKEIPKQKQGYAGYLPGGEPWVRS